ncbi:MAG TPA: hypothetical protein VEF04_19515 [Blastocatellia bacterium]|nr:hypothetical protein [Blastocatellia bacterium]
MAVKHPQHKNHRLILLFWLFQKGMRPEDVTDTLEDLEEQDFDFSRIRCPQCKWQPRASDLWYCGECAYPEFFFGGCGMEWNTFATRGICPGCQHQWRWTACLMCEQWSLHEDWYANDKD